MKKYLLNVFVLSICFILLSSFTPQSSKHPVGQGKYGVYKTYSDYINGKLTDLGPFAKCSRFNNYYGNEISFEKETIKPENTKYWGIRIPFMTQAKGHFNVCYQPASGPDKVWHYYNGDMYNFVLKPGYINVYQKFDNISGVGYASKDSSMITSLVLSGPPYIWAAKGDKDFTQIENVASGRKFFEDDPDLLKEYDNAKSPLDKGTKMDKTAMLFMQFVIKYNKKHKDPGGEQKNK